jgi:cell division protein FtsX
MFVVCVLIGVSGNVRAQSANQPMPSRRIEPSPTPEVDENQARLAREMAKKANQERQAALKNDTDKLVKLAGELKEYVDRTNENVLSLNVMKKAEEIEKLAHSVKEKMKATN